MERKETVFREAQHLLRMGQHSSVFSERSSVFSELGSGRGGGVNRMGALCSGRGGSAR